MTSEFYLGPKNPQESEDEKARKIQQIVYEIFTLVDVKNRQRRQRMKTKIHIEQIYFHKKNKLLEIELNSEMMQLSDVELTWFITQVEHIARDEFHLSCLCEIRKGPTPRFFLRGEQLTL